MRQKSWLVQEKEVDKITRVCVYCRQEIGREHKTDCVLRKKTVLVKVTFEMPVVVPEFWTPHQVEFHWNGSSSCCNNLIDDMQEIFKQPDQEIDGHKTPVGACLCDSAFEAEFVREMDTDDENHWNFRLETDGVEKPKKPKDVN